MTVRQNMKFRGFSSPEVDPAESSQGREEQTNSDDGLGVSGDKNAPPAQQCQVKKQGVSHGVLTSQTNFHCFRLFLGSSGYFEIVNCCRNNGIYTHGKCTVWSITWGQFANTAELSEDWPSKIWPRTTAGNLFVWEILLPATKIKSWYKIFFSRKPVQVRPNSVRRYH